MALYPGFYPGPTAYPGSADPTPRIVASPDPTNSPPRVLLQVFNAGTATSGQILRYGADNHPVPVRQGDPAALSSGAWVGYDYEIRYNQPARYEFVPSTGSRLVSDTTQLNVAQAWLVHPGVPSLSCPVTVKLLDEETMRSSGSLHDVLGGTYSVPVTAGRRKAPSFQMLLRTGTKAERDALDQLFYDEAPLLLQAVYPAQTTDEAEYRWLWFGDITRTRIAPQVYANGSRVWTLAATEVARPLGGIRAQRTWATLMLECATWADVMAKYKTWRGVLTGIPGI